MLFSNGDDPISLVDHSFLQNPFINEDDNLHLPISSFHFPSPFQDDDLFLPPHQELFLHHLQHSLLKPTETNSIPNKSHKFTQTPLKDDHQVQRRSSKKDRHSKINTLKGPRDRRMRLSLSVAREFFGLQDMLGVDKASKTVEWLLIQSKPAIKKLEKEINGVESKSPSSLSESEVVSGIDEDHSIKLNQQIFRKEEKKKRIKHLRKVPFHPLSKESREKARERARARTEKKQQSRPLMAIIDDHPDNYIQKSGNDFVRISAETRDESGGTQSNIMNPCLEVLAEIDQPTSSYSMITENWSPFSIFSSLHSNGISPHEDQFEGFPFIGKAWNFHDTHTLF